MWPDRRKIELELTLVITACGMPGAVLNVKSSSRYVLILDQGCGVFEMEIRSLQLSMPSDTWDNEMKILDDE